ncbi:heme oxygenase, putative [Plasmodium ovale]|uniref:Heme oxygenase, putative n=1 Tax=Plasmodium ovale TaxID=36330 RepID=A0A1D3TGN1_PLAOA|nr:heme oxygenase, putative [Plasmodium ovale]
MIIVLFFIFTLFTFVHNEMIHYKIYPENSKHTFLFLKGSFKYRKKYHLHAKEYINYKEIQIQRINDYRKRRGTDKNNINYNIRDSYNYHENCLFVRNEVFPTLAKIENEKLKEREKYREMFKNINDYNTNFSRQTFVQFLIDLYNIFMKIDEIFLIHKNDFSLLTYAGPMILTNYLYDDIIYLTSVVENTDDMTLSKYGREYISHLEELSSKSKLKFLAHSYLFYKNFHLTKEHLLNSICKYLNIIKKLKSSRYVPDVSNFEYCLNKMSRKWSRWDKDNFLASLHDGTDKMMILTKHFQKIKE